MYIVPSILERMHVAFRLKWYSTKIALTQSLLLPVLDYADAYQRYAI